LPVFTSANTANDPAHAKYLLSARSLQFSYRPATVSVNIGAHPIIRIEKKNVHVIYPTGIIVDIGVKLPKSVSDFLFSGFRIIGRAPVDR
jgi:hypothetical protein